MCVRVRVCVCVCVCVCTQEEDDESSATRAPTEPPGSGTGMIIVNMLLCTLLRPTRLVESRVGLAPCAHIEPSNTHIYT